MTDHSELGTEIASFDQLKGMVNSIPKNLDDYADTIALIDQLNTGVKDPSRLEQDERDQLESALKKAELRVSQLKTAETWLNNSDKLSTLLPTQIPELVKVVQETQAVLLLHQEIAARIQEAVNKLPIDYEKRFFEADDKEKARLIGAVISVLTKAMGDIEELKKDKEADAEKFAQLQAKFDELVEKNSGKTPVPLKPVAGTVRSTTIKPLDANPETLVDFDADDLEDDENTAEDEESIKSYTVDKLTIKNSAAQKQLLADLTAVLNGEPRNIEIENEEKGTSRRLHEYSESELRGFLTLFSLQAIKDLPGFVGKGFDRILKQKLVDAADKVSAEESIFDGDRDPEDFIKKFPAMLIMTDKALQGQLLSEIAQVLKGEPRRIMMIRKDGKAESLGTFDINRLNSLFAILPDAQKQTLEGYGRKGFFANLLSEIRSAETEVAELLGEEDKADLSEDDDELTLEDEEGEKDKDDEELGFADLPKNRGKYITGTLKELGVVGRFGNINGIEAILEGDEVPQKPEDIVTIAKVAQIAKLIGIEVAHSFEVDREKAPLKGNATDKIDAKDGASRGIMEKWLKMVAEKLAHKLEHKRKWKAAFEGTLDMGKHGGHGQHKEVKSTIATNEVVVARKKRETDGLIEAEDDERKELPVKPPEMDNSALREATRGKVARVAKEINTRVQSMDTPTMNARLAEIENEIEFDELLNEDEYDHLNRLLDDSTEPAQMKALAAVFDKGGTGQLLLEALMILKRQKDTRLSQTQVDMVSQLLRRK